MLVVPPADKNKIKSFNHLNKTLAAAHRWRRKSVRIWTSTIDGLGSVEVAHKQYKVMMLISPIS